MPRGLFRTFRIRGMAAGRWCPHVGVMLFRTADTTAPPCPPDPIAARAEARPYDGGRFPGVAPNGKVLCMRRNVQWWLVAVAVAMAACHGGMARGDVDTPASRDAIAKASAAYVAAYNARDYAALADQWTVGAELVEGGSRVRGRERIVASIRGWLEKHPQATVQITVADVEMAADGLARVTGTMAFRGKPGDTPTESRFASLRVREDGAWRLAESVVEPNHAAALDDMRWLLGSWQAIDARSGTKIDVVYEQAISGRAIIGRITLTPKIGPPIEALELIHADRDAGLIRATVHDSTGAHAAGVIESDGTALNRSLVGTPGDRAAGRRTQWVQTIVPGGLGRFTMQSIERSIDGRPLPDGQPMHFQRK